MTPMGFPGGGSSRKDKSSADTREASDLREHVWRLERALDQQRHILQALASLLARTHGISDAMLLEEVRRLEKAQQDAGPEACPKCGRAIGARQPNCIYCGEPRPVRTAFDLI
jgi:hypothetical protein